jgi:hypothetical protein
MHLMMLAERLVFFSGDDRSFLKGKSGTIRTSDSEGTSVASELANLFPVFTSIVYA